MARWILAGALVLLALWPMHARAEERPPNALEVGAAVATCMTESRPYPPGDGVEVHGTIYEATLVDRARPFAILRNRTPDSTDEAPVSFEAIINNDPYHQTTMKYGVVCFHQAVYPQMP
jgi:hypothetical protein